MAGELAGTIVVEFPLRGEGWVAVNSPADRIPSHGTNLLAQRYAYDFIKVDGRKRLHYHAASWPRTFLIGVPTRECYAWGEPVLAPFDGVILRAVDACAERRRVHPVREAALAVWNGLTFSPGRLPQVLGNHVILRDGDGVFAAFVHLAPGSVPVREGQAVGTGDLIGRVGHTGNSTTPHLHFQLMDAADPLVARAIPCAFRSYEALHDGVWQSIRCGIPRGTERIRVMYPAPDDEGPGS